jgi:excisionase family DNA binding protein
MGVVSGMDLEPLMTVEEVAEVTKLTKRRIYDLVELRDHDRLPAVRIGRSLRFRRADVEKYIEQRVSA